MSKLRDGSKEIEATPPKLNISRVARVAKKSAKFVSKIKKSARTSAKPASKVIDNIKEPNVDDSQRNDDEIREKVHLTGKSKSHIPGYLRRPLMRVPPPLEQLHTWLYDEAAKGLAACKKNAEKVYWLKIA